MLKKLAVLLAAAAFLCCGCVDVEQASTVEEQFYLSNESRKNCEEEIENTLNGLYWFYEESSLSYFESEVPQIRGDAASEIFAASEKGGFKLSQYAGRSCVIYTADLYFFNMERAGIGYFYFIKDKLCGAYYSPDDDGKRIFSLTDRNVYSIDADFSSFEGNTNSEQFLEYDIDNSELGFCSAATTVDGDNLILNIDEDKIKIYRFNGKGFALYKTIGFENGMEPVSASFYNTKEGLELAVILGSLVRADDASADGQMLSKSLVFFDSGFERKSYEYELANHGYTCVASCGEGLFLIDNSLAEVLEVSNEGLNHKGQYNFAAGATSFLETDLDNNGITEYVFTNEKDLFVYQKKNDEMVLAWRTNISVASFSENVYAADLNDDGVKEIYIMDITGTTVKYILSENGLEADNTGINYGQKIYAADFNGDGRDDYMLSEADEPIKLYIAK